MCSFTGNKKNNYWIWLGIDVKTKEITGIHIGRRSRKDAKKFWNSFPPLYRQDIVIYTNLLKSYVSVLPSKRHCPQEKHTGKTNHIEHFNNTVRQRVSRLVRKTLSFSKNMENHAGAVWNFVNHYNVSIAG